MKAGRNEGVVQRWAPPPRMYADLSVLERSFFVAMKNLGYGRFESVAIKGGSMVLAPWPKTIRQVRFDSRETTAIRAPMGDFELQRPVAEFFAYVRSIKDGVIAHLEVRHGMPFGMELPEMPSPEGCAHD